MASVSSALVQKLNRFFPLNQDELAAFPGSRRVVLPDRRADPEVVHERQEETTTRTSCRRAGRAHTSCCLTAAAR